MLNIQMFFTLHKLSNKNIDFISNNLFKFATLLCHSGSNLFIAATFDPLLVEQAGFIISDRLHQRRLAVIPINSFPLCV